MTAFTPEETEIVRTQYPLVGSRVAEQLGRTYGSVRHKATQLGLRKRGYEQHHTARIVWTEEQDRELRRAWPDVTSRKTSSARVAVQLGVTQGQARFRAMQLGLVRVKQATRRWTEEEDEFLCAHAHLNPHALQKRFKQRGWPRTRAALSVRRCILGQKVRGANEARYSATGLAHLLGVDHRVVRRWIKHGWLSAEPYSEGRHYSDPDAPKEWAIQPKAVRRFLMDYPAHVDISRADKFWLIDLLTMRSSD